jgi:hypothetical protein
MDNYVVNRYELHISRVRVSAQSETDAIKRVAAGDGEEIATEYHATPDEYRDRWTASKESS